VFYDRFKALCIEKEISMSSVLQKAGIASSNLGRIKNGGIPRPDVLIRIARSLGCSVDYLLGFSDYKNAEEEAKAQDRITTFATTVLAQEERIIKKLDELTPEQIASIETVVDQFIAANDAAKTPPKPVGE